MEGASVKALVQRVSSAEVRVDGAQVGAINQGVLVLLGVAVGDTTVQADWLADKVAGLRIFPNPVEANKDMDVSVVDIDGAALVVSQFTLAADTTKGKRPGFSTAAPPDQARPLYEHFVRALEKHVPVATGRFGANMAVALVNDGPVTFMLEK